MKIISRFRDFYDYKVEKYGVDEKIIYNRITKVFRNFPRIFTKNEVQPDYNNKILFVGDKIVLVFKTKEKLYTQFDLEDIELLKAKRYYSYSLYKFIYNSNLSQIGVYIDADFVWQSLVEFLSNKRSEKEISPEVSNENKILSKGFDLKTSFRPNMKKKNN